MTVPQGVVFLLDVDNTLLDNDQVVADLRRHLEPEFGAASAKQALEGGVPGELAGILVDEEFGADVLHDAHRRGLVTALPTERSGPGEFEFEFGGDFASHIDAFDPTFAKALVRYNPQDDPALNQRQSARLKQLADYCHRSGRRFMFELLVPATDEQLGAQAATRPLTTSARVRR